MTIMTVLHMSEKVEEILTILNGKLGDIKKSKSNFLGWKLQCVKWMRLMNKALWNFVTLQ